MFALITESFTNELFLLSCLGICLQLTDWNYFDLKYIRLLSPIVNLLGTQNDPCPARGVRRVAYLRAVHLNKVWAGLSDDRARVRWAGLSNDTSEPSRFNITSSRWVMHILLVLSYKLAVYKILL
ncbi:hypothetical protein HNY73_005436 [Argiope bruennichi]|uniref:Uncharacterized protein n=1 Tax=Argiope bruennichi TaxID=94029 RepID=A0A8T0FNR8_ARGBR|nr:hypothetical protein HNY73_005436 [Argiope bruennichi]